MRGEKLYIGNGAVLDTKGVEDRDVIVGIRPEGFIPAEQGALVCDLAGIEVMGRDVSIVSKHDASLGEIIRSIVDSDDAAGTRGTTVRYNLKPHKVFLFDSETEERIFFDIQSGDNAKSMDFGTKEVG